MERQVKERLVGAAVLMAAAVILIPEMLSGPAGEQHEQPAQTAGETPVKTYTIDLSKSLSQPAVPEAVPDTRAPPVELPAEPAIEQNRGTPQSDRSVAQAGGIQNPAPSQDTVAQAEVARAPDPAPKPAAVERKEASPAPAPPAKPKPEALASEPDAPSSQKGGGWAVQLGSFASRSTADRLAAEARGDGGDAFVMPVTSANKTLYRVRLGPFPSRAAADEASRKVKGKHRGATVVSHP